MAKSLLQSILSEDTISSSDGSFGSFLKGSSKSRKIKEHVDVEDLVEDLLEYMDNKMSQQVSDVKKNLFKHWKRGTYNTKLAETAWSKVIEDGAKSYASTILKESSLWDEIFPQQLLSIVVEGFEDEFHTGLEHNEIDIEDLFNE